MQTRRSISMALSAQAQTHVAGRRADLPFRSGRAFQQDVAARRTDVHGTCGASHLGVAGAGRYVDAAFALLTDRDVAAARACLEIAADARGQDVAAAGGRLDRRRSAHLDFA